jgi:hypothetical protein
MGDGGLMGGAGMKSWIHKAALPVLLALLGCARSDPSSERPENPNLAQLLQAYNEANAQLGHSPKNMTELRPFIEKQGNPDTILKSPRDHQPYEIRWGVSLRGFSPDTKMPAIVAYEKTGVEGERCVLTLSGIIFMEEAEFERAKNAPVIEMGAPTPPKKDAAVPRKDAAKSGTK